jgi:hypothetical protein
MGWDDMKMSCHDYCDQRNCDLQYYRDNQNIPNIHYPGVERLQKEIADLQAHNVSPKRFRREWKKHFIKYVISRSIIIIVSLNDTSYEALQIKR